MNLQYNQINNRDMAKEIDFLENKIYVGTFTVLSQEFTGKLIYESGNSFELMLYDTPSIYELTKSSSINPVIDSITGRIYDDKETYYNVVLVNCNCLKTHLWGKGCLKINFEYALFSETHIFGFDRDKNFTLDIYFDNWNEFCYPQAGRLGRYAQPTCYLQDYFNDNCELNYSFSHHDRHGDYDKTKDINEKYIYALHICEYIDTVIELIN